MGYIRRLEVKGFKSFGPKTLTITFEQGLNVVTGPNGSGKSNIADAILFALGENSPRILRAAQGRLSGLIYDPKKEGEEGSYGEERPTSCRATIQFDNVDRKIPVDTDLVTVSRELRGGGENVYYLNGRKATKGEISDLLEVSGLSPSGLNIIPQGAATRVADQTPDEKRKMIEEVVGIARFDDKKAEAQKQLSQADTKLQIELARTGEMKAQLERLEEQRNDLVKYSQLEGQVAWLTAVQYSRKVGELRERINSTRKQEEEMVRKLEEVRKRKEEFESRIATVTADREKFISEVVQGGGEGPTLLRDERESTKIRLDQLAAETQKREESMRRLEAESIPTLRVLLNEKRKTITASTSAVEALHSSEEKLEARRKEIASELKEVRDAEETLRSTIDKRRKQTDRLREKLAELNQSLSPLEVEVSVVIANLGVEKKRLEELDSRVSNFEQMLQTLESSTAQMFELQTVAAQELGDIDQNLTEIERRRNLIGQSIDAAGKVLEKASSEVAITTVKKEVTDEISGDRIGHTRLRKLCEEGGIKGYIGVLNQIISYPSQYARACAAVTDRWMSAFLVEDVRSMTAVIRAGKQLNIKSFAVIPFSEVAATPSPSVDKSAGVIGPVSGVLKADKQYRGLLNFIGGDTVLVETEAIAYVLASEGFRTVTPNGEVFELGGRAFAYGLHDVVANILQGLEDIEDLGDVESAVAALRGAIDKRKQLLLGLETESKSLSKDRIKKIAAVAAMRAEAETVSRLSKRYRAIFRSQKAESDSQRKAVDRLVRRQQTLQTRKEAMIAEVRSLEATQKEMESLELDKLLIELEASRNDLSIQLNEVASRLSEVHLTYSRERSNLEEMLEPSFQRVRVDLENAELKYEDDKLFIQTARKEANELNKRFMELDAQLQKVLASSTNSAPIIAEFNSKVKRLEEERNAADRSALNTEKEIFSLQQSAGSIQERIDQHLSQLRFYGYDEVLEVFESSDELLSQVQFEYEALGRFVNKSAVREYAAVYDNYRHLSERINELERERTSIVRFIESIDSEKRKVFMTAFETINVEFQGTFNRLTGGVGRLELENSDEVFSGGIYLMGNFRNKGDWESSSMSGGEKSVTAVALILAIQKVNPHPFYLFDEIDQNLDQNNSKNLAEFLRERSGGAQILVVSLKDTMVAQSNVAYGVYSVGGISRIVRSKMEVEVKNG
ncbi:MAG: chromosome segregation protein SMC [Nitrososphaerota archaeon]|nr:chromosome segregation protein SMC [Nitrososphaerota archaeon]